MYRMLFVTCPACGSQTLEWSDEAGACETCDYGGCADNADREPASLHLLRVWRGEYSHPGFVGEPESAKILRELKVGNAAMLADLLGVPRVGPEQDAEATLPSVTAVTSSGSVHITWSNPWA